MYKIDYDAATGEVHSFNRGFWMLDEAVTYREQLTAAVKQCRQEHGRLHLLIESSEAAVHSTSVTPMLTEFSAELHAHPRDRIAIVVLTALKQMQVKRSFTAESFEIFRSKQEAVAWLRAGDIPAARDATAARVEG